MTGANWFVANYSKFGEKFVSNLCESNKNVVQEKIN